METLKTIENELVKNQKNLQRLRDKIANDELKKRLPSLKKKYENTYWSFPNIYSQTGEKTIIFAKLTKVVNTEDAIFQCFESSSFGFSFVNKDKLKINQFCRNKITKRKYEFAFKAFKNSITI